MGDCFLSLLLQANNTLKTKGRNWYGFIVLELRIKIISHHPFLLIKPNTVPVPLNGENLLQKCWATSCRLHKKHQPWSRKQCHSFPWRLHTGPALSVPVKCNRSCPLPCRFGYRS